MKTLGWLLPVGAVLLLASSLAHAFLGWPAIRTDLEQHALGGDLIGALAVGWYFGSVSMAVFAVIVFLCWREAKGQPLSGRAVAACIALAYVLFGVAAFLVTDFNPHFIIAFVLPGLIIGLPVVAGRRRPRP